MEGMNYMTVDTSKANQVIEVSLGWVDVISIFTGAASLVMAALAIWLSITFYKMSDISAKDMKDSTNKINSNVEKLEKMFDTMYADTFSMVKETVTHMREQVDKSSYKDESIEIKKKVDELISDQLKTVSPENLSKEEIKDFILDIVNETKEIELDVKKKNFREKIINILRIEGEKSFSYLEKVVIGTNTAEFELFFDVVHEMTNEGLLNAEFDYDNEEGLSVVSSEPIRLLK